MCVFKTRVKGIKSDKTGGLLCAQWVKNHIGIIFSYFCLSGLRRNMLVKNVHSSTSTQVLNTALQYPSYSENDRKFQKVKFEIRQKE